VVEVADRPVAAVTYVGHAICASVAPMPGRWTDPGQPEDLAETRAPSQRLRAPFTDEH
jgi:hypothetical protein